MSDSDLRELSQKGDRRSVPSLHRTECSHVGLLSGEFG